MLEGVELKVPIKYVFFLVDQLHRLITEPVFGVPQSDVTLNANIATRNKDNCSYTHMHGHTQSLQA